MTDAASGGMNWLQRKVLDRFYASAAGAPERLPWHREMMDATLVQAIESREHGGRALDVGCGSGTISVHLARRGFAVTAIDLHAEAVAMARRRVEQEGVAVEILQADVLAYEPQEPFDVVYDSGCLHCMGRSGLSAYRRALLRWLAPDGEFVLAHWTKRHALDWRPMGPRRRTAAKIELTFAPPLQLVRKDHEDFDAPFPIGPRVRLASYWFHRPRR